MNEKKIIREAMYARRINQTVLASMMGMKHQSNIGGYLSGKSLRVDTFVKLMDAMGFDVIVKDRNNSNRENVWKIDVPKDGEDGDKG